MEPPVNILIVDDDEVCRQLLRDAIEEEDAVVALCADGAEALDELRARPFDILITDLNMPRVDGLNLLANARQMYPHILTIIITGYGSLESAIEAIRQGAYDYVQKPFKIEQISVVTRNAIEKIRILWEKAQLLKELELAYRRLQQLESESISAQGSDKATKTENALDNTYCLFPRHSLPLYFFETPTAAGSSHVLTELERLKILKREGVIDEREFSLLKNAIINNLGSKGS